MHKEWNHKENHKEDKYECLLKERYQSLYSYAAPSERLLRDTIQKARRLEQKHPGRKSGRAVYKGAIVLASACICLYAAMPVLAASSDSMYRLMYHVSPQAAQYFMPVDLSDTTNGIQMEVVSASVRGNTAQAYVTMQDLEGDRIDRTIDLYDSYSINRPFDSSCHCELVRYEESTKTATFLITIEQFGNQKIGGDKITFTVGTFLSGKKTYQDLLVPLELSHITDAASVQEVEVQGLGVSDEKWMDALWKNSQKYLTALVPAAPMPQFLVDGIDLTGIGYVDGMLHIQTAVPDPLESDNHGEFYLKNDAGKTVNSAYSFSYSEETQQGKRVDYHNEVFEIGKDELAGYRLYGDFVISGKKTDGKWRVTFPLEEEK